MAKRFLFLEVTDPKINSFFFTISKVVGGKPQKFPVHITVRGPYDNPIPTDTLKQCTEDMEHDILRIAGAGSFSNANEKVVYLKVDSPNLRNIWRKSDFPISKYGFNPHISLYRGNDSEWTERLVNFLQEEDIQLLTERYRFHQYEVQQRKLELDSLPLFLDIPALEEASRLKPGFVNRLNALRAYWCPDAESVQSQGDQLPLW